MKIKIEFSIGEVVYITTDPFQNEYMVVGIMITGADVLYQLRVGDTCDFFNGFELSAERDMNKVMNIDA